MEKKNGEEQQQIDKLKEKITELESKLKNSEKAMKSLTFKTIADKSNL